MPKNEGDRLVKIAETQDQVEAQIWRDALEREGVPVYVKSRDPLGPAGLSLLPGILEVYVFARDEKRARWVLGELSASA